MTLLADQAQQGVFGMQLVFRFGKLAQGKDSLFGLVISLGNYILPSRGLYLIIILLKCD